MKNVLWVLLLSLCAISFSACGGTDNKANSNGGNSNAAVKPEKDLKTSITALENSAYEAWKKKDGKFFDEFLADNFIGVGANGRLTKAGLSEVISKSPCEAKGFTISDEEVVEIGEGIVLLTTKTTTDQVCDDKATPSPSWVGAVYVKDGDSWKAAYHQTAPAADAKGENPPPPKNGAKVEIADADKALTETLSGIDKGLWEAWSKGEGKVFEDTFTKDYRRLVPWGREDRAQAIKTITGQDCKVKNMSHEGFKSTKFSDSVYMITYKTNLDAICDGNPLAKIYWSSAIYSKEGDKWSSAYFAATPAG